MFNTHKAYQYITPFPFDAFSGIKCYKDSTTNFNINVSNISSCSLYTPYNVNAQNSYIAFYQFEFNAYSIILDDLMICNQGMAFINETTRNHYYPISNNSTLLNYNNLFQIFITKEQLPTNPYYLNSNLRLGLLLFNNNSFLNNLITKPILHYPLPATPPSATGTVGIDQTSKIIVDNPIYFTLNHNHIQGDKKFYVTVAFGLGIRTANLPMLYASITEDDNKICSTGKLDSWYITQYANITGKIIE